MSDFGRLIQVCEQFLSIHFEVGEFSLSLGEFFVYGLIASFLLWFLFRLFE